MQHGMAVGRAVELWVRGSATYYVIHKEPCWVSGACVIFYYTAQTLSWTGACRFLRLRQCRSVWVMHLRGGCLEACPLPPFTVAVVPTGQLHETM